MSPAPSSADGTDASSPVRPAVSVHFDLHHQAPKGRHSPVVSADTPVAVTAAAKNFGRRPLPVTDRRARPARARAALATRRSRRLRTQAGRAAGRSEAQRHNLLRVR
jgi:hypothetical protein